MVQFLLYSDDPQLQDLFCEYLTAELGALVRERLSHPTTKLKHQIATANQLFQELCLHNNWKCKFDIKSILIQSTYNLDWNKNEGAFIIYVNPNHKIPNIPLKNESICRMFEYGMLGKLEPSHIFTECHRFIETHLDDYINLFQIAYLGE